MELELEQRLRLLPPAVDRKGRAEGGEQWIRERALRLRGICV
jgi:hypothetical protein